MIRKHFPVILAFILILLGIVMAMLEQPVHGQTRTYTNADLGKPISWAAPPPSADMMRALELRQFRVAPRGYPLSASTGAPSVRDWPVTAPTRRLDGTLLTEPPAFYLHAYLGRRHDYGIPTSQVPDQHERHVPADGTARSTSRQERQEGKVEGARSHVRVPLPQRREDVTAPTH